METIEPLLAEHPLFKGLAPKYLSLMVSCACNVKFNAGEFIMRDGDESNTFYLVRAGAVALDVYSPTRGAITINTLHEGDVLGWSWIVSPYRVQFDARAMETTRAIRIDAKCLREKCAKDSELALELYKRFVPIIVDRVQSMTMQLLDLYSVRS